MTEAQIQGLLKVLNDHDGFKTLKREFDRSWVMYIDEKKDERVVFQIKEKDAGSQIMTIADVALFLQTDRATSVV